MLPDRHQHGKRPPNAAALASHVLQSQKPDKDKIKSYNQIKLCTCMGMMGMARWILGQAWALDITIHDEMLWLW
jgi:hypothetical protein